MVIHNFSIEESLPFLLLDLNINSLQCLCTALIIGVLRICRVIKQYHLIDI